MRFVFLVHLISNMLNFTLKEAVGLGVYFMQFQVMFIREITVSLRCLHGSYPFIRFKPCRTYFNFISLARFDKKSVSRCERIFILSINDGVKSSKVIRDRSRRKLIRMCIKNELQPLFTTWFDLRFFFIVESSIM